MRTRAIGLVVLLTLLIGTAGPGGQAAGGGPRVRDVWYAFVADGQHYGSEHVRVSRQEDGTFSYEVEARMLLEFLGQPQELRSRAKYVVGPKYEPVSFELEETGLAGSFRTQGRAEQGKLLVRRQHDDWQRTASLDLSAQPLFYPCLDDWLADQPSQTAKAQKQVLAESGLELENAILSRESGEAVDAVWSLSLGDSRRGRLTLDPEGVSRELDLRAPRIRAVRVTAEEIRSLKRRAIPPREILMFAVGKPLGMPERLTSLTVRMTWKDIPFEQFVLTDPRQQVLEHSEQDGRHEALLRIHPDALQKDAAGEPLSETETTNCLAETRFIKPKDPDILRQAQAWAGDSGIGLEAVRKLSASVFKHLQGGQLIAETLSGPEVLKTRKGKCSEYAILFASAARSIGIPTRIVLGMRIASGAWIGHMWNEAYADGRWITVDATADEVGGSPALLKLVHSHTVDGTQYVRWELIDSLEVAAVDRAPRSQLADVKSGIDGPTYTNAELACRLTAPDQGWTLEDVSKAGVPVSVIRFKLRDHDDVYVHFVPMIAPPLFTPSMLMQLRIVQFRLKLPGFEVLKDEDYHLGPMNGRILVYRRLKSKEDPRPIKATEILWTDGTSSFLLNLIADEAAHEQFAADFFKLLRNFESLRTP